MTNIKAPQPSAAPSRFRPEFCPAHRRRLILIAAILASALGFIDGSVVSIALPAMRESLGADLVQATWISNAYMVTLSALILTGGALGDRFGLGRVFAFGIGFFILASVACAIAPTTEFLIAARAAKGIGAAIMVPGSLAIISRTYPREERGRAIGTWAAASALTTAAGPIIGGFALSIGGPEMWRWIFAINLPLGLIAIWLVRRGVEVDAGDPDKVLDLPGALLATAGLGSLAYALTSAEGGTLGTQGLAIAAIGALLLVGFLFQEWRSTHPMMPLALFANATFSAANLMTFTLYFGLSAVLFFLPMLVIAGWGVSEVEASLAFVPLTLFISLLSSRFGALADRLGPGLPIAAGSMVVALAYLWLGASIAGQDFRFGVLPPMMLMGLGMAMVVAPLSTAVMGAVDDSATGIASGVNNAISRISGLVAVALMTSVAALVYANAGGLASYGIPSETPGHTEAMNAAFRVIAWAAAGLSAISAVLAYIGIRPPPQTGS